MKTLTHQTRDNFLLPYVYIGKITDIQDEFKRDRVRVRILGIIADDVPDNECPWAEQGSSIFSGTETTSGISTTPSKDSLVYVQFLHGDPSRPVYFGYVRGNKDGSGVHNLEDLSTTIHQTRLDNKIGPELDPLYDSSEYPLNNVLESKSGHIIEMDDTDGNNRVSMTHNVGSYFEIRPDGTIQIKSIKDFYEIIKANIESYVEGNLNELIKGAVTKTVEGNYSETVKGTETKTVEGDSTITLAGRSTNLSGDESITAGGSVSISAPTISLN